MSHIFILSGPSGAGKDTVIKALKKRKLPIHFAVTVTTRPKRADEVEGEDYRFVSLKEFEELKKEGKLVEWAQVYGNWYGVPRGEIENPPPESKGILLRVDIQGAKTLKSLFPQAVLIFLSPPDLKELIERLKKRDTESTWEQELRLKAVSEELNYLPMFNYHVINLHLEEAVDQIEKIIRSHL